MYMPHPGLALLQNTFIKQFHKNWALITNDPLVLETVQGYHVDFLHVPHQQTLPLSLVHNPEQSVLIDLEVPQMLEKCAIHPVASQDKDYVFLSTLFLGTKKGAGNNL